VVSDVRPDLEEIENRLDDFEPEREEFVEADGPFDFRDEHLLDLLKDIISSSDTNCGDSLANAICAAKDAVYSIEGDKPTEPPVQVFDPIDTCDT
jgi:hypothetical protein